jgi:hypothetical protein
MLAKIRSTSVLIIQRNLTFYDELQQQNEKEKPFNNFLHFYIYFWRGEALIYSKKNEKNSISSFSLSIENLRSPLFY